MHFTPFYAAPFGPFATGGFIALAFIAVLWEIVLKGFGLWYSARSKQKWWFIAMLIFNTLGILPIIYLLWFRPKDSVQHTREESPVHISSPAE